MAPHGVFRSAGEDCWVSLTIRDDEEWQRFCRTIGRLDLGNDVRFTTLADRKQHEDTLEALVTEWTRSCSPREATIILQSVGIPAAPAMSNKDIATDSHLKNRPIFVYNDHPEVGVKQHIGIPWQLSKTPLSVRPAPLLGQDTDYVLREVLGYSAQEVAAFREKQALS